MEVIVVTHPEKFKSEIPIVVQLFENGLSTLHLRKPRWSTKKSKEYLDAIPPKFHSRIVIHSHHKLAFSYNLKGIHLSKSHRKNIWKALFNFYYFKIRKGKNFTISRSFHQLESLEKKSGKYDYVFLHPFFSSIDQKKNSFDVQPEYLNSIISKAPYPVIASGNISLENAPQIKKSGCMGIALSGFIWKNPEKANERFLAVKQLF